MAPASDALSIVTYHYLRDRQPGVQPGFDALTPSDFAGQLDYFERNFAVVHPRAVTEALNGGAALPERALLLSFDDGLKEHYTIAFPMLHARGWAGVFFPPATSTGERRLLDVHKIHMVLAHSPDRAALAREVRDLIDARGGRPGVRPSAEYWMQLAKQGRYDGPDTVFVKKVLQRTLPDDVASEILDTLLARHVGPDQRALADRHYLMQEELAEMARAGQEIGGHGVSHRWLDRQSRDEKAKEIVATARFVAEVTGHQRPWVFSYPFGGWDADGVELLRANGCAWAVSTEPRAVELGRDDRYRLPRFDTNDFPRA
jgi:peptidoglycan/xylan/chitin deacetylase (PgdA/CDA1 family)